MLKIGQNWGEVANYPPQCSTKICTSGLDTNDEESLLLKNKILPTSLNALVKFFILAQIHRLLSDHFANCIDIT